MQVIGEPRLGLRALQVAARLVDVHRRHPRNVRLHHSIQHFQQPLGIGLAPKPSGITESVRLVVVVVGRREVLHPVFDCGVGDAIPVLDAGRSELDVVPRGRLFHANVMGYAKAELVRLVLHRRHDVAVGAGELDSVRAHLLEFPNASPSLVSVAGKGIGVEACVDEDARRGHLALVAALAKSERLLVFRCRHRERT